MDTSFSFGGNHNIYLYFCNTFNPSAAENLKWEGSAPLWRGDWEVPNSLLKAVRSQRLWYWRKNTWHFFKLLLNSNTTHWNMLYFICTTMSFCDFSVVLCSWFWKNTKVSKNRWTTSVKYFFICDRLSNFFFLFVLFIFN